MEEKFPEPIVTTPPMKNAPIAGKKKLMCFKSGVREANGVPWSSCILYGNRPSFP